MSNEKMAKSTGNILKIKDFKDNIDGQVLKLALMSAHYKQPLDWNEKLLEDQKSIIEKWYQMYDETNEEISLDIIETLLDDLNSPGFIAKIHELYVSAKKGGEQNKKNFNTLNNKKITSCCMELIPRISRAQSMDVLSSQANLAGYRSVIDAAEQFGKAFPMMMTAAGRVNPAKVMVLGVGVAGLQDIATVKRLGAVGSATNVRSANKEQVESLGGKFIMVEDDDSTNAGTEGGYAKEMSDEYKKKQAKLIAETIAKQDIVICTALIPGKTAPILITQQMVESMASGSVVVDLAVEAGGNCPLSKLGEVVDHNGVKVIGYANVPGRVAKDASALYAKNIFNFLSLIIDKENKNITFNWEDEIVNAVVLTNEGKLRLEQFN